MGSPAGGFWWSTLTSSWFGHQSRLVRAFGGRTGDSLEMRPSFSFGTFDLLGLGIERKLHGRVCLNFLERVKKMPQGSCRAPAVHRAVAPADTGRFAPCRLRVHKGGTRPHGLRATAAYARR